MKQFIFYAILFFLTLVLQTSVLGPVLGRLPQPNLLLLLVIILAILSGKTSEGFRPHGDTILFYALFAGLLIDIYSSNSFPSATILFVALTFLAKFITEKWIESEINLSTCLLATVLVALVFPVLTALVNGNAIGAINLSAIIVVNFIFLMPLMVLTYVRAV